MKNKVKSLIREYNALAVRRNNIKWKLVKELCQFKIGDKVLIKNPIHASEGIIHDLFIFDIKEKHVEIAYEVHVDIYLEYHYENDLILIE